MWMNLENITQVKETRHKSTNIACFYLNEIPTRLGKFIEIISRIEINRDWERRNGELLLYRYRVSF